MFEAAEVGHRISKATYTRREPKIRAGLLDVQRRLATSHKAVVVLIGGAEGAGKEETVALLLAWMDARGIETHAMWEETDEERERPPLWRFWRALPPRGKMAVLFGSWYSQPIIDRVFDETKNLVFEREMRRIVDFEQMLAHEDVLLVKFWLHVSDEEQLRRFKQRLDDPARHWKISAADYEERKHWDAYQKAYEDVLSRTSSDHAPWYVIPSDHKWFRNLAVSRIIADTLEALKMRCPKPSVDIDEIRRQYHDAAAGDE